MKYNKIFLSCCFAFLFLAFAPRVAFAETDVSGVTISEDTTWTADASPYIVHDDIYVAPGVTLTLEPGTIVKFDYGTNLYVFGNLIADGSVDAHVSLTSLYDDSVGGNTNMEESSTTDDASTPDDGSLTDVDESIDQITDPTPSIGDWQGVSIFDGGSYNFTDTDISYTNTAITSSNSSGNFSQVSVQHSQNGLDLMTSLISISQSNFSDIPGMFVQAFATSSVSIGSSNLEKIGKFGVVFDESSFSLQNSSIENMSAGTYDTLFTLFGTSTADIENSAVKYASGYVVFENFDNGNLTFASSTLMNISGNAAFVSFGDAGYATTSLIISNSDIATGTGNGLILFDKLNAQIQNTKIHGFSGDGIQADSYPVISIQGSSITNNTIGIRSVGSYLTAHGNVIENNSSWGIFAPNSQDFVDVQNNWWGDASGPQERFSNASGTSNGILDAPVSGGEGITNVTFAPWLESAPGTKQPCCSNVLFIPGIEASRLYDRVFSLEDQLWEPGVAHDNNLLDLDVNGQSLDPNIYTRDVIDNAYVPYVGNVYYSFIQSMNNLKSAGTINDWTAAPYDWRLSLEDILNNGNEDATGNIYYSGDKGATSSPYIVAQLRRLAASSQTGKVTIIAHSNGGLVTKVLTNALGPEASKLIDKIIFVAVPQVGTPAAIGALLHGFDQGFPMTNFAITFSAEDARNLAKNMPGAYNLLPSTEYFTSVSTPVISFATSSPLLAPWIQQYGDSISSENALTDFLTHASDAALPVKDALTEPAEINTSLLDSAETIHAIELDNWQPPVGVQFDEIAGWGKETLAGITYYSDTINICPSSAYHIFSICLAPLEKQTVLEYKPNLIIDGDDTVVTPSALWTTPTGAERYYVDLLDYNHDHPSVSSKGHHNILEIPQFLTFLGNVVSGKDISLPDYISTSTPVDTAPDNRLEFILHSPLSLGVIDDEGNYTGISSSTGTLEENIPDSDYQKFGEVTYISVPASTTAHVLLQGQGSGLFTLDISSVSGTTTLAATTFAGIPVSTSTEASITIPSGGNIASATPLLVDEDGNGTIDFSLSPELNATVLPTFSLSKTPERLFDGGTPFFVPPTTTSMMNGVSTSVLSGLVHTIATDTLQKQPLLKKYQVAQILPIFYRVTRVVQDKVNTSTITDIVVPAQVKINNQAAAASSNIHNGVFMGIGVSLTTIFISILFFL